MQSIRIKCGSFSHVLVHRGSCNGNKWAWIKQDWSWGQWWISILSVLFINSMLSCQFFKFLQAPDSGILFLELHSLISQADYCIHSNSSTLSVSKIWRWCVMMGWKSNLKSMHFWHKKSSISSLAFVWTWHCLWTVCQIFRWCLWSPGVSWRSHYQKYIVFDWSEHYVLQSFIALLL